MDPQWLFILDTQKKSIADSMYTVGDTTFTNVNVQANFPYQITANNTNQNFLNLTDNNTTYTLQPNDNMIQISSITYTTIFVPLALNRGGKRYYISNNTNKKIIITSIGSDILDGASSIILRAGDHTTITSNNFTSWLVS